MRNAILAALLACTLAAPSHGQDAVPFGSLTIVGDSGVAQTAQAVTISRLTMQPGKDFGLAFDFAPRNRWPEFVPPTPLPDGPWRGGLQYTVWACAHVNGQIPCGGFIQMWTSKQWTGAPILAQWNKDWAYDGRWGALKDYVPMPGDEMFFFLVAGNARNGQNYETAMRERSNVVAVRLPAGDAGVFDFAAAPPPTTGGGTTAPPTTPTVPQAPTVPAGELNALRIRLEALETAQHETRQWLEAEVRKVNDAVVAVIGRVGALESRPWVEACEASVSGIPIRCRLRLHQN